MALEVADVFRRFGAEYLARHGDSILPSHRRAIEDITTCRTPERGGQLWHCPDCDRDVYVYHGCRNRSCPACHTSQTREWLAGRQAEILPCPHFHLTATVPEALRPAFRSHQKLMYGLLFQATIDALLALCRDPKYLGALPAILAALHTWDSKIIYHPHLHCLVSAGGLAPDGQTWIPCRPGFLVPVLAMSPILRGKFRDALRKKHPALFDRVPDSAWHQKWVVNCIPWAAGEQGVLDYLARYVFRIAITNRRVIHLDDQNVTFRYKDRKGQRWRNCTLEGQEFIRRYLQHVLPRGFHKVRYFGLWHHAHREQATRIRQQLQDQQLAAMSAPPAGITAPAADPAPLVATTLTGQPPAPIPRLCPHCQRSACFFVRELPRPRNRGP